MSKVYSGSGKAPRGMREGAICALLATLDLGFGAPSMAVQSSYVPGVTPVDPTAGIGGRGAPVIDLAVDRRGAAGVLSIKAGAKIKSSPRLTCGTGDRHVKAWREALVEGRRLPVAIIADRGADCRVFEDSEGKTRAEYVSSEAARFDVAIVDIAAVYKAQGGTLPRAPEGQGNRSGGTALQWRIETRGGGKYVYVGITVSISKARKMGAVVEGSNLTAAELGDLLRANLDWFTY